MTQNAPARDVTCITSPSASTSLYNGARDELEPSVAVDLKESA